MNSYQEIKNLVYKFQELGIEQTENETILIGKTPQIGTEAWLNKIYKPLSESDLKELENNLNTEIPKQYKDFLRNFSNGLNILVSTFSLYGLRKNNSRDLISNRQPYSIETPNIFERHKNAKESYFYIGAYDWDGSLLFIDKETEKIHCCERFSAISRYEWNSLEEMIISEITRIYILFDDKGKEIDEHIPTIPYK